MKNLFLTVLASCLFFSTLAQERETPYQEGELLIQFLPRADIEAFENDYTFLELRSKKLLSRRMNIWLFEYNPARATGEEAVAAVYQHRDVLLAQLNHFVTLRGESSDAKTTPPAIEQTFPNDPQFPNQWALNNTGQTGGTPDADIDAPEAWDIATGGVTKLGDEIIVAVIDGGGELTHSDLSFWKNIHEIPNNGIDDDNNGYVDDYNGWNAYSSNGNVPSSSHGTHVSGIAAAKGNNALGVSGVNWNAKVMPIAGSSGTESIVVEAYGYALEQRARYNETNGAFGAFVVVTNSSFGVDFGDPANFPIWCAMYDSMGAQGILSCGATANLNINIDIEGDIPTACPSDYLLSVTNTTSNDLKNSGAAYGLTTIDLGAPGTSILNTDVGNSYSSKTGTSMASPTVAGAVALLYAAASPGLIQIYKDNPAETALLFKQWIMDGTDPIPSLQGITVTGGRLNVYNSAVLVQSFADSLDPNPPANITAYSDYTTPASMQLAWDDPTHYAGGDPLLPGEFTIEIQRDSVPVASIPGGAEQYTDMGLNDGQLYTYRLYAKVIATDSTSEALEVSWHAGGSPVPAAPANLACAATSTQAILTWSDPTAQEDGTPLDDLDHINIYRNGSLAGSAPPGAQTYTDNPPPGFTYTYTVRAVDDETPPNLSAPSNTVECFVGSTPNFLVWVGPDATGASAASGDSIFDALVANGKSSFLTNDLFEFGADLSIYDAIFVVLGIFPNNHEIVSGDPEGQALQSYLQNGGSIYLEGGDCFNYDPETGGYNIRPWFGLNDGPDGSADVGGVTGLNDLSGFNFAYNGENNWMDELQPSGSTSIWKNSANNDLSGVFYAGFGSGKSIGVVPSFGGLVDNPEPVNPERRTLENYVRQYPAEPELLKARPERGERPPFIKKAAYPEQSQRQNREIPLYRVTPNGVEILANTKEDLMAAYLDLLIDATCTTGLLGDVTGDDAVNSTDGLIMLSYDASLPLPQPFLDRIAIGFGDVTEDGSTTSTDALVTLTWEAGLPVPFPVGTVVCLPNPAARVSTTPAAMGSLLKDGQAVSASALANVSSVTANQVIAVPVAIDMAQYPGKLGSFTAELSWNPAELQFLGYRGGNSAGFEAPVVNDLKASQGRLIFANANPHGGEGAVNVLNLEFRALSGGAANVSLEFSAMAAALTFTDLLPYLKLSGEGSAAETENIPQSFAVDNYPNPFNPATTIRYQLPEAAAVQLVIYNVLGQQVRSLVNERREAGYHHIAWDGRNDAGAAVGSGIYIYRFTANNFSKVQKMMLLK